MAVFMKRACCFYAVVLLSFGVMGGGANAQAVVAPDTFDTSKLTPLQQQTFRALKTILTNFKASCLAGDDPKTMGAAFEKAGYHACGSCGNPRAARYCKTEDNGDSNLACVGDYSSLPSSVPLYFCSINLSPALEVKVVDEDTSDCTATNYGPKKLGMVAAHKSINRVWRDIIEPPWDGPQLLEQLLPELVEVCWAGETLEEKRAILLHRGYHLKNAVKDELVRYKDELMTYEVYVNDATGRRVELTQEVSQFTQEVARLRCSLADKKQERIEVTVEIADTDHEIANNNLCKR